MEDAINVVSSNRPARRRGRVQSHINNLRSLRCHVAVLSPPMLRFAVLLLLLASVVEPAAVDYRSAAMSLRAPMEPRRYQNRRLVDGRLKKWQVAGCRQHEHYVTCFLCGKIVQSRDVYYGCCHMDTIVLQFCDQLLA